MATSFEWNRTASHPERRDADHETERDRDLDEVVEVGRREDGEVEVAIPPPISPWPKM